MKQIVVCPNCIREIATEKIVFQCRKCKKYFETNRFLRTPEYIARQTDPRFEYIVHRNPNHTIQGANSEGMVARVIDN